MTPTETILARLRERGDPPNEYTRGRWLAHCPAHDDPSASLSVTTGDEGRVLLYCFAGCPHRDILRALSLPPGQMFHRDPEPAPMPPKRDPERLPTEDQLRKWHHRLCSSRAVLERLYALRGWSKATVVYAGLGFNGKRIVIPIRDSEGDLATVVYYNPERGAREGKARAARGHVRPLWPPPELYRDTLPLWLVEGEPDALSARELGLLAVGVPGVNGWREKAAERFTGRRVYVAFDCDTEGRTAARRIQASLAPYASLARVIDLAPERDDGYDLTDLLVDSIRDDGLTGTRAAFQRINSGSSPTPKETK